MPRNIPPALSARLRDHSTTLCYLLKVVPREADTFGITTCNRDVDFDDGSGMRTYRAKRGYTASDTETKSDLSVNNAEADGLVAEYPADGVTKEGIARGDYDGAAYMHYLIDYEHPEAGFVLVGAGTVGRVTTTDDLVMKLEMRSLTQTLKQASMIELTSITCRAKFGDERCKMPLVWASGIVAEVGDEADRTFYADPSPINDVIFATGDGSATQFQLKDANGNDVTSGFVVDSIHQTDWQGRIELSDQSRTNNATYSNDFAKWINFGGAVVSLTSGHPSPDGGSNASAFEVHDADGSYYGFAGLFTSLAGDIGGPESASIWLRADVPLVASLAMRSSSGTSPATANVDTTWTKATVQSSATYVRGLSFGISENNASGLPAGTLLYFCFAEQEDGDTVGAYISTTTDPVTITDYTLSGNQITLGQVSNGATLDWTGSVDLPSADGHFVPGVVHWDTGGNAGRENEVDTYEMTSDGAEVSLVIPTHALIQVGDTFRIRQDCDKSRAMCRDRYHNILNFRGEPDIPRGDATSLGAPKPS